MIQEQSEIAEETTTTKTTIRKTFVILAAIVAVIAAFSQLVTDTKPDAIELARKDNINFRKDRDATRDQILTHLEENLSKESFDQAFMDKTKFLLSTYRKKEEISNSAYDRLNKVKADHKVRGFKHLNAFLGGIGLPISFFCVALVIYIIGIFLQREKYASLAVLVKLIAKVSFILSLTYIYWALNPKAEIHQSIYVLNLLLAGYFTYKIVVWILKRNFFETKFISYDKFRNALARVFDYIIIEVNDKFISEEQKVDFIKSYDKEIDKISEIID